MTLYYPKFQNKFKSWSKNREDIRAVGISDKPNSNHHPPPPHTHTHTHTQTHTHTHRHKPKQKKALIDKKNQIPENSHWTGKL